MADGALHGYTLAAINDLASRVVRNNRAWWPAGDRDDQHAAAWHGIAEHLAVTAEPPSHRDLMEAGRRALATEVKAQMRHRGDRRDGTNNGANFSRYWDWHAAVHPSPELAVVEAFAVRQITTALTGRQAEALTALAAAGDYHLAAQMLGIEPQTFRSLLGRARREFFRLWHEGEEPSRPWRTDRRVMRHETDDPKVLAERARYAAHRRADRAAA